MKGQAFAPIVTLSLVLGLVLTACGGPAATPRASPLNWRRQR